MTINEVRSNLSDLKFFLNELDENMLHLMKVIYEVEEKICDIEFTQTKEHNG